MNRPARRVALLAGRFRFVGGLLLAAFSVVAQPEASDEATPAFDTLRDPTVLSSRLGADYEYLDQNQSAFRQTLTLSGAYAFGGCGRRDWIVSSELPFVHQDPGTAPGKSEAGVGDFKLGFGHVFAGTGSFRWGLGAAVAFDTASEEQFGDGVIKLSPKWGGGLRLGKGFEIVANLQYNISVHEAEGRAPVNSFELKPALLKTWPHFIYSLAGYDSSWDFENSTAYRAAVKAELGKGFGRRQQWVSFVRIDVPVVRAGNDHFAVKGGITYVFK